MRRLDSTDISDVTREGERCGVRAPFEAGSGARGIHNGGEQAELIDSLASIRSADPWKLPSPPSEGEKNEDSKRGDDRRDGTPLKVFTLGTAAGPVVWRGRVGICTVIQVEGVNYMVDAGIGSAIRYRQAGLPWNRLRHVFITHMHSDHYLELPHLLLIPWELPGESFTAPVTLWGPGNVAMDLPSYREDKGPSFPGRLVNSSNPIPGLTSAVEGMIGHAFQADINIRYVDENHADIREMIRTKDITIPADVPASYAYDRSPRMSPFTVFEDERVKVTGTLVDHRYAFPAFAFRFDTEYGSVVCSGDMRPNQNFNELAADADLVLHEAVHLDAIVDALRPEPGLMEGLLANWEERHTPHTMVGKIAEEVGAKSLLLSHLAPGHKNVVTDNQWLEYVKRDFSGTSLVGNDMQVIEMQSTPGRRIGLRMSELRT